METTISKMETIGAVICVFIVYWQIMAVPPLILSPIIRAVPGKSNTFLCQETAENPGSHNRVIKVVLAYGVHKRGVDVVVRKAKKADNSASDATGNKGLHDDAPDANVAQGIEIPQGWGDGAVKRHDKSLI